MLVNPQYKTSIHIDDMAKLFNHVKTRSFHFFLPKSQNRIVLRKQQICILCKTAKLVFLQNRVFSSKQKIEFSPMLKKNSQQNCKIVYFLPKPESCILSPKLEILLSGKIVTSRFWPKLEIVFSCQIRKIDGSC